MSSSSPSSRGSQRPAGQEINAHFLLNALRQWWILATPVGLVLAAVVCAAVFALHKQEYKSSALIEIRSYTPFLAFKTDEQATRFVENQVQLIRSPVVLFGVTLDDDVRPFLKDKVDPVAYLSEIVSVSGFGQSDLFSISSRAQTPEEAYAVTNAVLEEYFRLRTRDDSEQIDNIISQLHQEETKRRLEVTQLQNRVKALAEQRSSADPFAPEANAITAGRLPLANLIARLTEAEVNATVLDAQIQAAEQALANDKIIVSDFEIDRAVQSDDRVRLLRAQIDARQELLDEYRRVARKQLPRVSELQNELAADTAQLEKLRKTLTVDLAAELQTSARQKRQEELAALKTRRAALDLEVDVLQKKYDEQLTKIQDSSGGNMELEFQRSKLARAEAVVDRLADRIISLSTERQAPSRVQKLREPSRPTQPIERYPVKLLGLAGGASLLIPFALCILWELRVQRIRNVAQLEDCHSLVVVGEVATLPARRRAAWGARGDHAIWLFEESIDSLRTALVLSDPLKHMQVLCVTSAVSQEGKTSVATQLAVSLSRATGEKTLLIDGDLRSPDIHNVFEVDREPGLAKFLDGMCGFEDAVQTWSETLHVMPAGRLQSNPHRLVMGAAFTQLLDEARQKYRYIVLDTPPILAASESLVMNKAADSSLVCAMRDYSRLDQVRQVHDRLVAADAKPFGIVLNGVPTRSYAYRYGRYDYARAGQTASSIEAEAVETSS